MRVAIGSAPENKKAFEPYPDESNKVDNGPGVREELGATQRYSKRSAFQRGQAEHNDVNHAKGRQAND